MRQRGCTLVEVGTTVVVVALVAAVLLAMGRQSRNGEGLQQSIANMSRIMQATAMYHADHAGQAPMRGARYINGTMSGWNTWNVAGKNCNVHWQTAFGGIFDESAYSRVLNPYLEFARIPRPPGYINTGSGATWTFHAGTPTAAQRTLQLTSLRSPGDTATRQRQWPNPTPGVSCYDDVGSSYLVNMSWWEVPGLPSGFTPRYNEGSRRIGLALGGANPNYVFMNDQTLDIVSNQPTGFQMPGEFGKINASVVGYADGRVNYIEIVPGALNGPGYTLAP